MLAWGAGEMNSAHPVLCQLLLHPGFVLWGAGHMVAREHRPCTHDKGLLDS